jgi:ubiquinone/menaquinone biosynthesis C-methylase UbiE
MTDAPGNDATVPGEDPDEVRSRVRDNWERAAAGWSERAARFQSITMPVSQWLIDAIRPQPGQRVLELAAGIGETGFLAAELIEPGGMLICTDGAEAMLEQARARAEQLGLRNVEFKPAELEWIDNPTADVDAVLCRWGYMFALDPEAALRETRRVLRPGGRVALATWTPAERNPWGTTARQALYDAGLIDTLEIGGPGPFSLSDPTELGELLETAGFGEVELDEVPLTFAYADMDDWFATTRSMSRAFADVVDPLGERQLADLRKRFAAVAAPFAQPDGSVRAPGVALVAAAEA